MLDQDGAQIPRRQGASRALSASSPSKAPSTAARSRRSPPAARPNISRASAPRSTASTRCRSAIDEALGRRSAEATAGILIEPIQGEGGIRPVPPRDAAGGCASSATSTGMLLVLDEVQCGIGRTGKLFAHEWAGITPDIMAIAKGIGGGFPMGACLATEEAAPGMTAGTPWLDLRRQSARHGGRQCGARCRARRRLPRPGRAVAACCCKQKLARPQGRASRRSSRRSAARA